MAIMPHCVVCGFYSGAEVAGSVEFADYHPGWQPPSDSGGPVIGWSNSLGVTAPDGVGLFCREHLRRAKRLRHLPSEEAVRRMRADADIGLRRLPRQRYTPWIRRVAAYVIDAIGPAFLVLGGVVLSLNSGWTKENPSKCAIADYFDPVTNELTYATRTCEENVNPAAVTWVGVGIVVALAFCVWNYGYLQGKTGSSIGKRVLRFKVVREKTAEPIGFGRSIVRQFVHGLDSIVFGVGLLLPLWDAKRQTLGDKLMSTVCLPINTGGVRRSH